MDDNYTVRDPGELNMKSSFLLLQKRLDACKKEISELEEIYNQLREALGSIPIDPQHRQQIEITYLQCAKKISILKSRVLYTEMLSCRPK